MNRTPTTIRTRKDGGAVKRTVVEVPIDIYETVERMAIAEDRSIPGQIVSLLRKSINGALVTSQE